MLRLALVSALVLGATATEDPPADAQGGPTVGGDPVSHLYTLETTTVTPWDSSSGNSDSSDSLNSFTSESSNDESSSSVDPSGSATSWGWKQSGSSGSYMNNLLWFLLLCCLCAFKGAIIAAICGKPKPKPKPTPKPAPAPAPAPEPVPVLEPLMPMATP